MFDLLRHPVFCNCKVAFLDHSSIDFHGLQSPEEFCLSAFESSYILLNDFQGVSCSSCCSSLCSGFVALFVSGVGVGSVDGIAIGGVDVGGVS